MRLPPGRAVLLALAAFALAATAAGAASLSGLTSVGTDPTTNATSQHATAVEPDTYAYGSTIVAAFQVGRFTDSGASDIGWAVGTLSGGSVTWTHDALPSLTAFSTPTGPYDQVTDPSVAYDAKDGVWLIGSLGLSGGVGVAVVVSRWDTSSHSSPAWDPPVTVASVGKRQDFDKDWVACDNSAGSPFYGRCYVQWDDFGSSNRVHVAYSSDGGLHWTEGSLPKTGVIGGQPVVQPGGRVVMPLANSKQTSLISFVSDDGGLTWQGPFTISSLDSHQAAGGLRMAPLPSAEIDAAGTVYLAWADCRFERHCAANDIVLATSTDGQSWSAATRVPIDAVGGGADHFLPGLGVDPATSGGGAHLGLLYYFYPVAKCGTRRNDACQLEVGYVSSADGGSSWSTPAALTPSPMTLSWLPQTSQGRMVGDYNSTSFLPDGKAYPVFAVAAKPTAGGDDCATATPSCNEAMYVPDGGLAATGGSTGAVDVPVFSAGSDHAPQPTAR